MQAGGSSGTGKIRKPESEGKAGRRRWEPKVDGDQEWKAVGDSGDQVRRDGREQLGSATGNRTWKMLDSLA